jgi:hypothetical protein
MVSAQLEGKLLERYEAEEEERDVGNKSEYLRALLRDGLDAREQTAYDRVDLPERLAARLEDERGVGDREKDVLREVVEDGLGARRGDALDAIGAGDNLRRRVEKHRDEGEPLDDAIRRLVRTGVESGGESTLKDRVKVAIILTFVMAIPTYAAAVWGLESGAIWLVFYALVLVFEPSIARLEKAVRSVFSRAAETLSR